MITIVDYKTANLGSIVNMFKHIGVAARIATRPADLEEATHIVLPGIGHFDICARNLRELGFQEQLNKLVAERPIPILGICAGAQLLTHGSDEGVEPGLGWIDAFTRRFPRSDQGNYKIPHMGWNTATPTRQHALFSGYEGSPRFYFVHSYYMDCAQKEFILATSHHGIEFASVITSGLISGVQFHPEKSHKFGVQLLRNFADIHTVETI